MNYYYYYSASGNPNHHQQSPSALDDAATQVTDEVTEQRSIVSELSEDDLSLFKQQQQQQDAAANTMNHKKRPPQIKGRRTRRCVVLSLLLLVVIAIMTTIIVILVWHKNKSSSSLSNNNNPNLNVQSWQQVGNAIHQDTGAAVAGMLGASLALSANGMIVAAGAPHATNSGSSTQHAVGQVITMDWDDKSQEWYSMMMMSTTTTNGNNNDLDEESAAAELLLSGSFLNDFFGSAVALSASGWTLAAGASRGGDDDEGYVRVFDWHNATQTWQQVGQNLMGMMAKEGFGESVALSAAGDIVAVGGTNGGDKRGLVRVFSKNNKNGMWTFLGQELVGTGAGDEYGKAIALSEDGRRLAVGASQQQTTRTGFTQVFEYDDATNQWSQRGNTLYGYGKDHWFGETLDLSADGNVLAVGERGGSNGAGQVRMFVWNETATEWNAMGQILQGKTHRASFGSSVALSSDGQTLVVGSYGSDGESNVAVSTKNAGHVSVFAWDRKKLIWQQVGQDINGEVSFESFGSTVVMSADGTVVAAGGPTKDGFSGNVRVFRAIF